MSSREMARATGATLRQLQYWDEQGLLPAKRFKRDRSYAESQIKLGIRIVHISKKRRSLQRIKHLLRKRWTRVVTITGPTVIRGVLVIPKTGAKFA